MGRIATYLLAVAIAVVVSGCAAPKSSSVTPSAAAVIAKKDSFTAALALINKQDRPLGGISMMGRLIEQKQLDNRTFAQFYAITGDELGMYALIDQGLKPNAENPVDTDGYSPQSAIEVIVNAARNRRIVMLNEDHTMQRQRAFAFEVATALRKIGFTHFGAETFTPELTASMKDGVPKLSTGIYTLDPVFADLARHAMKIGYQLFDYEIRKNQEPSESADRNVQLLTREQAQADNIKQALDANPNARVFIYLGGGHGSKIPLHDGTEMMALRLKNMTGIDPFVIDQIIGTARSRTEYDGAFYRGVASLGARIGSVVMVNATGQCLTRPGHDLAVFHPRMSDFAGRPGWLTMNGYRKPYALKFASTPARTLVRAFVKTEPAGSIAMDQILIKANQTEVSLMLPVGEYSVVRQTESGESTQLGNVVIR